MKHFWMDKTQGLNRMIGQVFTSVKADEETLTFANDQEEFIFEHTQDCCENVYIEDIAGDLEDLAGSPLVMATVVDNIEEPDFKFDYEPESYTWTFYKFATIKGYVTVRWLGTSNGYYSESVDVYLLDKKNNRKINLTYEG